ncbi:hypothetical protein B0H15DRAFT_853031 [Mycena belliarum]|uniref:Uncharacterized protein n=1 Tax=Mycena belliarum TaxID=1033014 RepID=A0AAD6XNH2_9AGAR|nr:hypothetical protein B0H15DRAFT_853031 [Mycena belliae]
MTSEPRSALEPFNLDWSTHGLLWDDDGLSDLTELDEDDTSSTMNDREEGEISDDAGQKKHMKNIERNRTSHMRGRASAKRKRSEQLKVAQDAQRQVLAALYHCPPDEIHIHLIRRDMKTLYRLQDQEEENGGALTRANVDQICPDFKWIYEPGIHLGFLSEGAGNPPTVVFAVKIRYGFPSL